MKFERSWRRAGSRGEGRKVDKPKGRWRCRACGQEWHGNQLYDDPNSTAVTWTCADLDCGGICEGGFKRGREKNELLLECEEETSEARPLQLTGIGGSMKVISAQLPAWLLPGPRKKYTTAQRKKRKAALKATAKSRVRSRPKKLSRRKRGRRKKTT